LLKVIEIAVVFSLSLTKTINTSLINIFQRTELKR
jgi:hypothetical protein